MGLVSKQCVDFVKSFEGFYSEPYYDIVGVKTLGYGMTGAEIQGLSRVTEAQASRMLEDLLNNKYATPIKQDLDRRGIKLNQNQFDALVSMAYNVGYAGVLGSTLYRNICNGVRDVNTITSNFLMWNKAGGRAIEGLTRRRREEAAMFFGNDNISSGSTSDGGSYYNVKEVQDMLIKIGYPCGKYGADGSWGNGTKTAVEAFQKDCNLKVDGWVGNNTYHRIVAEYNKKMGIKPKQEVKKEEKRMDIILYFGYVDEYGANLLRDKLKLPVLSLSDFKKNPNLKKNAGKIYMVGGQEKPTSDTILISSNGRYDTAQAVIDYIKKNY
ncbi:MAG: glycoside hydrolase family protein [Clostridium sporogenes]|nr:glycoside hydrolase family protein [Clostridium sporogenes]